MNNAVKQYYPFPLSLSLSKEAMGPTYVPRKKMVLTWQTPVMFMSYAVCSFLVGLMILVVTLLIRNTGNWSDGLSVSIDCYMVNGLAPGG